ncbi:MAG: formyltetrahydrofolate deformylase [Rickettsiales bacterium]
MTESALVPDKIAPRFVLLVRCGDVAGIVAAVAGFLTGNGFFIRESAQFGEETVGMFFMRVEFSPLPDTHASVDVIRKNFAPVGEALRMEWRIEQRERRHRGLLMVSKETHCLSDILYRAESGLLPLDVVAVVSNHPEARYIAARHGVNFYHMPVSPDTKPDQERALADLIERERVDIVALAKYMQILSPFLTKKLAGRAINIHHSFLPSFKGARPYHQAYEKGVKIIGATAHYVSDDLDEGPIIHQEVRAIDRPRSIDDLIRAGRDVETRTLADALRFHLEYRVIMDGNKTVVFG